MNGAENLNLHQFPAPDPQPERQEMLILKEKHYRRSLEVFVTLPKAARRAFFDIGLHHHLVSKALL